MTQFAEINRRPESAFGEGFRFYDEGWNARVNGEPYKGGASLSWRDGWKDCDQSTPDQRTVMS